MTRSISPTLAPVLGLLELNRPVTVSRKEMELLVCEAGVGWPVNVVIQRLSKLGWLKETEARGVWEFLPAERAGAFSTGDPLLSLRATLTSHPHVPVAVALGSALWYLDIADRRPDVTEVALPPRSHVPAAIRRSYRVVRHETRLPPVQVRAIPVHAPASVLVHLATRPTDVRSWAAVLEVLPELVSAAEEVDILTEIEGRTHATRARFAYLVGGIAPKLVERLRVQARGKVWFGPRGPLRRHDSRWNIADTLLPFPPSELGSQR